VSADSIKTLQPRREESRNWDTTHNMYIEGDNFDALKLLQKNFRNKIQLIYIDPPYNTGKSFVYRDNYRDQWRSMMYPRLALAYNLLTDNGLIYISIDHHELVNLKTMCDEIFGEVNYISVLAVENNPKGRKNSAFFSESYEFCLVYANSKSSVYRQLSEQGIKKFFTGIDSGGTDRKLLHDEYGTFRQSKRQICGHNKSSAAAGESSAERWYTIYYAKTDNTEYMELLDEYDPGTDSWVLSEKGKDLLSRGYARYAGTSSITGRPSIPLYSKQTVQKMFNAHLLYFKPDGSVYAKDREDRQQITSFWPNKRFGLDLMTESATSHMEKLFGVKGIFANSKSVDFIKALIQQYPDNSATVLDFFSGSAATAHAVMRLNAEDGGSRRFIMVQIPEACAPKSTALEAGYATICEIGKERIRRAGDTIIEETGAQCDIGFRVYKIE
jgi:adenine-specific DNA-methyltransferase